MTSRQTAWAVGSAVTVGAALALGSPRQPQTWITALMIGAAAGVVTYVLQSRPAPVYTFAPTPPPVPQESVTRTNEGTSYTLTSPEGFSTTLGPATIETPRQP